MTEQIDPTRSGKPYGVQQQDGLAQRKAEGQKPHAEAADRVSLGQPDKAGATYGPGLKTASGYELLRNLVIKTFEEQGLNLQISTGDGSVDLTSITPEEAQALVAEYGYFGVEQTSQRIVDFAINAFGQDPSRLEQMKAAIDDGFQEAQKAFGGALPEISQQTYDAIMDKLDSFAAESDAVEE